MAERRMFAKSIIDSDEFLDMPASAQNLYFHLGMRADDEGFLNNPKRIVRDVRASEDDFKLLIAKQYIILFDSGIVVLTHWRIHNYLRTDRFKSTLCTKEKAQIETTEDKSYRRIENTLFDRVDTIGIPNVNQLETQYSIGKDSIGKDSIGKDSIYSSSSTHEGFVPPTPKEVNEYAAQVGCVIDGEKFVDDFTATGWIYKGVPLQDWKAVIRSWRKNNQRTLSKKNQGTDRYKATSEEMANMTANAERIDLD